MKELYLHVGNGGITFKVEANDIGTKLIVEGNHLGNVSNKMEYYITYEGFEKLAKLFKEVTDEEWNPNEYDHSARPVDQGNGDGSLSEQWAPSDEFVKDIITEHDND